MQATIQTEQAQQVVAQQQAALAGQLAQSMAEKGIRPGKSGQQQPNNSTGPGSQAEGVAGAGPGQSGAAPVSMAA